MTHSLTDLPESAFEALFPLIPNHLNPNAGWNLSGLGGCLFETHGDELAFIQAQDHRAIWTLIDGDDGGLFVVSGFHVVNRIGYLVSTVLFPEGVELRVTLDSTLSDAE